METNSRPNSTVLHHAIATGDIETVHNLLKQGVVNADARLKFDDDILETASRKSFTSISSYRQQSFATESIMEEERQETHDDKSTTTTSLHFSSDVPPTNATEPTEVDGAFDDIDKIMEECQNELDDEAAEQLEVTVIEVPPEDNYMKPEVIYTEPEPDVGATEDIEESAEDDTFETNQVSIEPSYEPLRSEEEQRQKPSPFLNNNRKKSLADTIDLKLRDENECLFERAASIRVKEMSEEDGKSPKRLLPRIKRKISLKWTKKPKKEELEYVDDDDLTYENLVKTRNVDDEQLEENFEGVAFFEAVRDGMDMIVQTLLETSNNYQLNMLDENGFTPAMQAAWHGQAECLEILLNHGANLDLKNATGCTAAHFAAGQGHTECLQLLISDDEEQVNAKTKFGATPLILAAKGGHRDCMEALLKAGADPNIQYRGNQNALLFAAGNGHYECIEALLEYNVDLNQPNSQNVTPLMRAVQQGHNTCVALLSDKGADINSQDAIGRTAIHFAVEHNNTKGLKLLLQSGASLDLKTKGGSKPLDYAERFQNTKCAEILENHLNKLKEEREKEREQDAQKQAIQEKDKHVSCISFKHIFRRRKSRKNVDV